MGEIKVYAGDFIKGRGHSFSLGSFSLKTKEHNFLGETITGDRIEMIEVACEANIKKLGGTVGWGLAGGVMLGPVGLLAGLLLGGRKKEVSFVVEFKDGRKILATTDSKTFIKIKAAAFDSHFNRKPPKTTPRPKQADSPKGPIRCKSCQCLARESMGRCPQCNVLLTESMPTLRLK